MITLAKRGDLHARRQALAVMRDKTTVHKLFAEAPGRFSERAGGYTRVIKIGTRPGDAAPMSLVEFVAAKEKTKEKKKKPKVSKKPAASPKKEAPAKTKGKKEAKEKKEEKEKKTPKKKAAPAEPKETEDVSAEVKAEDSAPEAGPEVQGADETGPEEDKEKT
jgi:large subunit ribosomal protein L17